MKKNFLGWINQIRNRKNSSNLQFRVRERKEKKKEREIKIPPYWERNARESGLNAATLG